MKNYTSCLSWLHSKTAMADDKCKYVIMFKAVSENENDEKDMYCDVCQSAGFKVLVVPVLDFEFIHLNRLLPKINNPDNYSGIIFSSPRCVKGLEICINEGSCRSIVDKWRNCQHFAVGEKTGKLAENLGFVVRGKEAGNSSNLAEIITKENYVKPFLYPVGSLTTDHFKAKLSKSNIELDAIVIYQTKPHPQLEKNLSQVKFQINQEAAYFVFFSPSGINYSFPILNKLQFDLTLIKFIAIGPTTEAALNKCGINVSKTCLKPNPESLLQSIIS